MASTYSIPYQDVFQLGVERPYLKLSVTGLDNRSGGDVFGLLDTGADRTSMPVGYASLMGYTRADLEADKAGLANGATVPVFSARRPVSAFVTGLPQVVFELWPTFVPGNANVLWGRSDVFQTFDIGFQDSQGTFTLTPV